MDKELNIVIIGLGGIGSILCEKISRFLNFDKEINPVMTLIDGDSYERKNLKRQDFTIFGNKAQAKAKELLLKFKRLDVHAINDFVDDKTVSNLIKEKDIVFLAVDNHKTRMIVSDYCKTLSNVILISGGNEYTDGNAQLYIRKGGEDLTPNLCAYHPEIRNPEDKLPGEMSCQELAESAPQLYFTNLTAATIMCWLFYNAVVNNEYTKSEVYFDISTMTLDSKIRKVK